jgi:hypothetical protein
MNSTREEFCRALVQAFGDAVSEDESGVLLTTENAALYFALSNDTPVQIGAIKIPLLRVEISVRAGDDEAARTLQDQVDRATQRGGG